ncbi:MAG: hypothetical protein FWC10_05940 [Lentimicrobiaceae bacterium]|nr:hypothetical protein [Lentimicrobiaceae bacterium]
MKKDKKLAQVFHFDLYGKRQEKYDFLLNNDLKTIKWQELKFEDDNYFFVPKDFSLKEEYEKGVKIDELFPTKSSGIKTQRDDASIKFTKQECDDIKSDFLALTNEQLKQKYGFIDVRDWTMNFARNDLKTNPVIADKILYRPFDIRFMNFTGKTKGIMGYPRYDVMQHFITGKNIGLVSSRQFGGHEHFICFITDKLIEISSQPFAPYNIFPLYLYKTFTNSQKADEKKIIKTANLNKEIADKLTELTNLQFMQIDKDILEYDAYAGEVYVPTEHTEKLFDYIYAILHSPSYREKYKEFLKIDFPCIPYPENAEQFNKMAVFGEKLRKLHLMENVEIDNIVAAFPKSGSNTVENSFTEKSNDYRDNRVYINEEQYFDNVPKSAWNFYIGGYQPAQKWLKDRKGRTLNYEEIEHYQKMIWVLKETEEVMREVDKILIIDKVGND